MRRRTCHEARPLSCIFATRARVLPRTLFVYRRRAHALTVPTRTEEAVSLVARAMFRRSALWLLPTHSNGGERAVLARAFSHELTKMLEGQPWDLYARAGTARSSPFE